MMFGMLGLKYGGGWGMDPSFGGLILLLGLWDLVWRGIALWRSARAGKNGWFIALLVLNTLGILPLIYLLAIEKGEFFNKKKSKKK